MHWFPVDNESHSDPCAHCDVGKAVGDFVSSTQVFSLSADVYISVDGKFVNLGVVGTG